MCNVPLRYGFVIENDNMPHIIENDDLMIYSKAVMSSDSDRWLEAMNFEMDSMYTNQVWTSIDVPKSVIPIGCQWIFKKKIEADG